MLAGKRAVRVGDLIMKEISYILLSSVKDPRVSGVTITGIDLSNDLKRAKLFFSLLGDDTQVRDAQAGLESARGYIKREIGRRMSLRYVPEITFAYDPSLSYGSKMDDILEKLKVHETENDAE